MKRLLHIFIIVLQLLFTAAVLAGTGSPQDEPSKKQNGKNLVLMCLSAHPDDEDGATLAYYAKLNGVKTYSIFYTRGEGGQNETGSELYDDLGALRTKETLAAAKVLGSEVYFLGFPDFGFSKTAKETFSKWGGNDSVLERLVYVIRSLKPDIIITNHDTVTTKPNRQHGNHQVVGITALEAFEKAADPHFHPEQLNDSITPWQVKKLYYRVFRTNVMVHDSTRIVELDMTKQDAGGTSIAEISIQALRSHRSQGMDKLTFNDIPTFFRTHRYTLFRQNQTYPFDPHDLFSGIDPSERRTASIVSWNGSSTSEKTEPGSPKSVTATFDRKIRIGLVKTYDNTLEETMKSFSINYTLIDSAQLAAGDLKQFTTILLDLRTYAYRSDAERYNDRLLEYMKNGGNVVCFYNKTGDWNKKKVSPYSLTVSSERVTEEDAPVTILEPNHPLFNHPNHIDRNDWGGWVQERSIYLPSEDTTLTSSKYERLLAMSDEDDHQPSTSLLWTKYGNGTYSYVSLALYRQLRNMNNGAMKLFFNLISQQ